MTVNTVKNIVIVGGGAYGITTARAIAPKLDASKYKIIVITPRPSFVHYTGSIRPLVSAEGLLEEKILMPYENTLMGKGEILQGKVASFTEWKEGRGGKVELVGGEIVPYEVLLLTPGSLWSGPLNFSDDEGDLLKHFGEWRTKFEQAQSVAIVGGGAVGIGV